MAGPWEKYGRGSSPQSIPIGPQDPTMPYRAPGAVADINQSQASTARTNQQIAQENALFNARKRSLEAEAAQKEFTLRQAQQPGAGLNPVQRQQLNDRSTAMNNLEGVLQDMESQYKQNFQGYAPPGRWLGALGEMLPGSVLGIPVNSANQKFNSTALRAGPFIQSILGLSGKEADAAAEYERKVMPFIPKSNEADATTESKLKQLRDFLSSQRANVSSQLGNAPPRRPQSATTWYGTPRNAPRKSAGGAKFLGFED